MSLVPFPDKLLSALARGKSLQGLPHLRDLEALSSRENTWVTEDPTVPRALDLQKASSETFFASVFLILDFKHCTNPCPRCIFTVNSTYVFDLDKDSTNCLKERKPCPASPALLDTLLCTRSWDHRLEENV